MKFFSAILVLPFFLAVSKALPTSSTDAACNEDNFSFECLKNNVEDYLGTVLSQDTVQVGSDAQLVSNGRSIGTQKGIFEKIIAFVESHDFVMNLFGPDSKVVVSGRNLNENEMNFKVKFGSDQVTEARKSKLKKVAIPIMVFVLLKAMTLIPLALGVLGLKAWNALQLSFFAFIISISLAVFKLCKKLATDNHLPHITHAPWEAKSLKDQASYGTGADDIAYSGYYN